MPICRLCATEQDNVVELFCSGSQKWDALVECICGYLGFQLKAEPSFPKALCTSCQEAGQATKMFLLTVQFAQEKLLQLASAIENNTKIEEEAPQEDQQKSVTKSACKIKRKPREEKVKEIPTVEVARSKRVRRPPKRFTEDLKEPINTNHMNSDALITTPVMGEMRSASGNTLAEILEADTNTKDRVRLVCEYCKAVFTRQNQLLSHLETHKDCRYECAECLQSFSKKVEFEKHQKEQQHMGMGVVESCELDTKRANGNKELRSDLQGETAINIVVGANGQITSIAESVKMENDVEKSAQNFACSICDKAFASHYAVRRHHKQVHVAERKYKCTQCEKSFKNQCNFAYHMSKHTGERPYICEECGKSFILKHELSLHMRQHTGVKPYKCDQCQKSFAHRCNYVVHLRVHSGVYPFKCETCDARFNSSTHLKKHRKIHLYPAHEEYIPQAVIVEETPKTQKSHKDPASNLVTAKMSTTAPKAKKRVEITSIEILPSQNITDIINNTFETSTKATDEASARNHLEATHRTLPTAYKHQCTYCLKHFKQSSALRKHLRTHSGDKPYKCSHCPKSFADASNFKRHKMRHLNGSNELQNFDANNSDNSVASDPDPDGMETLERYESTAAERYMEDIDYRTRNGSDYEDVDMDELENKLACLTQAFAWHQFAKKSETFLPALKAAETRKSLLAKGGTTKNAGQLKQRVSISYQSTADKRSTTFYVTD